ncbi:MAG: type II toxin-antitoxin system HicA family toxin [Gloeomargarita sp. SKYG116]|nr:type II toxin-antitoxin system HicA family toxin [Gloeomargarita sp. SKYG116]MDW8402262.1 type II toxin-antitoxin system HicA family toxin [Gloeomargarita sp. SKYGB_i_bin116]
MSKKRKLLEQLLRLPPEMDYEQVEQVLGMFGFVCVRSRGSHQSFRHLESGRMLTVPKFGGQVVKRQYLKQVREAIEDVTHQSLEELLERDDL